MRSAIVISATSDIGKTIFLEWEKLGWKVEGTYRTATLFSQEKNLIPLDLLQLSSIKSATQALQERLLCWDVLVMAPGTLEPVGPFAKVDFDQFEKGIHINFLQPLRLIHSLLSFRKKNAKVLFFAGAGTNSAANNYSCYAVSKIGLIKMCELLQAEMPTMRFCIVGPGWVDTKIHAATLQDKEHSGENYYRTKELLEKKQTTPMKDILACIKWLIETPCDAVGGRNFSVVYDSWGTNELEKQLEKNADHFKLRRKGNEDNSSHFSKAKSPFRADRTTSSQTTARAVACKDGL